MKNKYNPDLNVKSGNSLQSIYYYLDVAPDFQVMLAAD